ncbi:MAG: YceI family protein [Planctomycetota bacterium]
MHTTLLALVLSLLSSGVSSENHPAAETYEIDGGHSSVIFRVIHLGVAPFYGRFNDVSGTFTLDGEKSKVEVTIKSASIDTASERRDGHLKSPDFFNARQFPVVKFTSTKVEPGEKGAWKVTGNLELHGQKKPVTIELKEIGRGDTAQGYKIGFDGRFEFKRSDFDMKYLVEEGGLGDEIQVILGIEAKRQ